MSSLDEIIGDLASKIADVKRSGIELRVTKAIDVSEEEVSDKDLASESFSENEYTTIFNNDRYLTSLVKDSQDKASPPNSIFIDGTLRTVKLFDIQCGSHSIPIFLTNIVVGALERKNQILTPLDKIILYVLLVPEYYIYSKCGILLIDRIVGGNNNLRLDFQNYGNFYDTIVKEGSSRILFSDTTMLISSQNNKRDLPSEPIIGKIRRYADDRARVLMRMAEYSMLKKLHDENYTRDHVIFVDGPIGLLTPYNGPLGLPKEDNLRGNSENQKLIYDLFKNTIGLVKNVIMVPPDLSDTFKMYFFTQISGLEEEDLEKRKDHIRGNMLSWYYRLRPQLLDQFTDLWSSASAFTRVDIFVSFLLDESYRDSWFDTLSEIYDKSPNKMEYSMELMKLLDQKYTRDRISELIRYVKAEAYPIPPTDEKHRMLVESYGIYEVEEYIKSFLLHPAELISRFKRAYGVTP